MFRRLRTLLRRRPFDDLTIACFPKSGSTFLGKLLQAATGLPEAYLAELGPQREQDLSRRKLRRHTHRAVVQQHFKATEDNLELLTYFGIRPIVQTRSLFDVVVSLHDHYDRDAHSLPCGVITSAYAGMTFAERMDYLIAAHLPWYFNFYLSWREAVGRIEMLPLRYEDLIADPAGQLTAVLRFYRYELDSRQIAAALRQAGEAETRRNVGVAGRGLKLLDPRHRDAIRRQAGLLRLNIDEQGSLLPMLDPSVRAKLPARAA